MTRLRLALAMWLFLVCASPSWVGAAFEAAGTAYTAWDSKGIFDTLKENLDRHLETIKSGINGEMGTKEYLQRSQENMRQSGMKFGLSGIPGASVVVEAGEWGKAKLEQLQGTVKALVQGGEDRFDRTATSIQGAKGNLETLSDSAKVKLGDLKERALQLQSGLTELDKNAKPYFSEGLTRSFRFAQDELGKYLPNRDADLQTDIYRHALKQDAEQLGIPPERIVYSNPAEDIYPEERGSVPAQASLFDLQTRKYRQIFGSETARGTGRSAAQRDTSGSANRPGNTAAQDGAKSELGGFLARKRQEMQQERGAGTDIGYNDESYRQTVGNLQQQGDQAAERFAQAAEDYARSSAGASSPSAFGSASSGGSSADCSKVRAQIAESDRVLRDPGCSRPGLPSANVAACNGYRRVRQQNLDWIRTNCR